MVGLAEGELGSSSQTHSLASNKSRWDRRVVDSSDQGRGDLQAGADDGGRGSDEGDS